MISRYFSLGLVSEGYHIYCIPRPHPLPVLCYLAAIYIILLCWTFNSGTWLQEETIILLWFQNKRKEKWLWSEAVLPISLPSMIIHLHVHLLNSAADKALWKCWLTHICLVGTTHVKASRWWLDSLDWLPLGNHISIFEK